MATKTQRRTITLNLSVTSDLLAAAEQRAAALQISISAAVREVAEEAYATARSLTELLADEQFLHKGTRADHAGDTAQLQAARTEIAQLKQSLANANSASTALSTELDRANEELERLREEFRTAHFRLKCSQEALAEAKAELETVHAVRRAEAEAEDYAAEKARIEEADVDRALMIAALTALRRRTDVLIDRKRAEDEV